MELKGGENTTTTSKTKQKSPSHHKKMRGMPRFVRSTRFGRRMLRYNISKREASRSKRKKATKTIKGTLKEGNIDEGNGKASLLS